MYLGLDLGTSSLKVIIADERGRALWVAEEHYEVQMSPTRAQIAPHAWWDACVRALGGAPAELRSAVRSVGVDGQMHGVVLVDDRGEPVRDAILWPDRRAVDHLPVFRDISTAEPGALGNPVVPGMPGPVLAWLQANESEVMRRATSVVAPKDWLRSKVTGESPIVTDASDASATLMYDVWADDWSPSVLEAVGVERELLPTIVDSDAAAGTVSPAAAEALGVPPGIPVAVGAGDAAAALLGLGVEQPGRVLVNVGTGAQVIAVVDAPDERFGQLGLHQFRSASSLGRWYVMAPIINAGLALSWVRRVLRFEWSEIYGEAGVALQRWDADPRFVPFLAGERDPDVGLDAQASWSGLSTEHDGAAMARSALLGVTAYLARRTRSILELTGATEIELSGGATRHSEWAQLLATLVGVEVNLAPDTHASARGAAVTAARASGGALAIPPRRGVVEPQLDWAELAAQVVAADASQPSG